MDQNLPEDKVVDFSKFESRSEGTVQPTPINQSSVGSKFPISKRTIILIIFLMALVITQGIIIIVRQRDPVKVPAGYQIVKPQNGPPRVEKIK